MGGILTMPGNWVAGVEIGGTKLQCALGTPDGKIAHRERGRVVPGWSAKEIYEWVEAALDRAMRHAESAGASVSAIGVGFGGPVDTATGTVLERRFGVPVIVENDANTAGWAEYRLGAGQGTKNFFYMNIGSGIGGALIVNGALYNGQGLGAAEVGHTWVPDWTRREPGVAQKLELLCSGWSIERRVRAWERLDPESPLWRLCGGDPQQLTTAMLGDAARQGDAAAMAEINAVARAAGIALANVATLFHPEVIALGGGVSLMGEILLAPLKESFDRHLFGPFQGKSRIVPCQLEEDVVVVGALLLAGERVASRSGGA